MGKDLSIIIPSFNTKEITSRGLKSIYQSFYITQINYEIIVVDNASSDGSVEMIKDLQKEHTNLMLIDNKENLGFAKANNIALQASTGRYILFLNSDVIIDKLDLVNLISYMDNNLKVGALTVKVDLPQGIIDPASHRGFPTVWNSFCYFLKFERVFGHLPFLSRVFGGYHMTYCDLDKVHEIDSPTGAFFLTRKKIMDKIKGFDEVFFMYGEDLDLSFRIKELGYKIIYYPIFEVTHLKYSSGLGRVDKATRDKIKNHFYEAMKIFYKKHYEKKNQKLLNKLIYTLIDIKQKL